MKQKFISLLVGLGLVAGLGLAATSPVAAINVYKGCEGQSDSAVCKEKNDSVNPAIQAIIGLLIFAIGAISVIMIIVGGIRYVVSNGDASKIKTAKDTIFYAVVGLIVALLAYAIVNFVVNQFG